MGIQVFGSGSDRVFSKLDFSGPEYLDSIKYLEIFSSDLNLFISDPDWFRYIILISIKFESISVESGLVRVYRTQTGLEVYKLDLKTQKLHKNLKIFKYPKYSKIYLKSD